MGLPEPPGGQGERPSVDKIHVEVKRETGK